MKTLTEKYQALLEGNFSKKQFTRDARLAHPNFITQFTSYDDAIRILKGKGLVYEKKNEQTSYEDTNTYTSEEVLAMSDRAGDFVLDARESLMNLIIGYGDTIPKQVVLKVLSNYDLELEDVIDTDTTHNQEEIPSYLLEAEGDVELRVYSPDSNEVDILDTVSLDQVRKGIDYELKEMGVRSLSIHKDEWSKAKDRVRKNLQKDRNYYLHKLADTKPVKAEKRADTMKEVPTVKATAKGTKSNEKKFKDQQNQMEKVKLSESINQAQKSSTVRREVNKKAKTIKENIFNTPQMGGIFTNKQKEDKEAIEKVKYLISKGVPENEAIEKIAEKDNYNVEYLTKKFYRSVGSEVVAEGQINEVIKTLIKKVIVKTLNEESKTNTSIFSNEVKSSPQVVRELDYPRSINQAERRVANEVAREVHQNLNLPTEFHENERLYAAFLAAFEEQALQKMADLFSNAGSAPDEY